MARLIAASVGRAAPLFAQDGSERFATQSAINKRPVSTLTQPDPCAVTERGLDGDESVERRIHGPPLQAVYVYPLEHYRFWQSLAHQHGRAPLPEAGALGENLTIEGLSESQVWVGDLLAIGSVRLRVTRPRDPCFKLNARLGLSMAAKMMVQSGYTGFYCAVVQTGTLAAGDPVALTAGDRAITVLDRHRLDHRSPRQLPF
ncbi:MAG: MOSC domain-containing protein [Betaproteobacteria bacterium]|nr:MOSC domain-containing protein [Betaproteobacteria bacterium]